LTFTPDRHMGGTASILLKAPAGFSAGYSGAFAP
jgi:hypothetical protein